jgi:serine/threonine protein kinase
MSAAYFDMGDTLGEGSYGWVMLARMKHTNELFAIKVMNKAFIKKEKKVQLVITEKNILARLNHPRLVKLCFAFHDKLHLCMVMELCPGGELLDVIHTETKEKKKAGMPHQCMEISWARFYAAEILIALRHMHESGVVHRDIKPENIMLDATGHIKITDFGTGLDLREQRGKPSADAPNADIAFVGTPEYVSPEVLRDQPVGRGCDLWALGVILYQMLVGRPCFQAENEYLIFQLILNHPTDFGYPTGRGEEETEGEEEMEETEGEEETEEAEGAAAVASVGGTGLVEGAGSVVGVAAGVEAVVEGQDQVATQDKGGGRERGGAVGTDPMYAEARDLIARLLLPEAADRLGAGDAAGSVNGYDALMAHPFFKVAAVVAVTVAGGDGDGACEKGPAGAKEGEEEEANSADAILPKTDSQSTKVQTEEETKAQTEPSVDSGAGSGGKGGQASGAAATVVATPAVTTPVVKTARCKKCNEIVTRTLTAIEHHSTVCPGYSTSPSSPSSPSNRASRGGGATGDGDGAVLPVVDFVFVGFSAVEAHPAPYVPPPLPEQQTWADGAQSGWELRQLADEFGNDAVVVEGMEGMGMLDDDDVGRESSYVDEYYDQQGRAQGGRSPSEGGDGGGGGGGGGEVVLSLDAIGRWAAFLEADERIVLNGLVDKRKGFFTKKRQLLLTTKPRLFYVDPVAMELRGEIPWQLIEGTTQKSADDFDVHTPGRSYHFAECEQASSWVDAINSALR